MPSRYIAVVAPDAIASMDGLPPTGASTSFAFPRSLTTSCSRATLTTIVNLTRIYTRTGDGGETQLGDLSTTSNRPRLPACADVDEANASPASRSPRQASSADIVAG